MEKTGFLKAEVPISRVSKWYERSSIRVTADVYGHVTGHEAYSDRF